MDQNLPDEVESRLRVIRMELHEIAKANGCRLITTTGYPWDGGTIDVHYGTPTDSEAVGEAAPVIEHGEGYLRYVRWDSK